jgi:hypothetical protein
VSIRVHLWLKNPEAKGRWYHAAEPSLKNFSSFPKSVKIHSCHPPSGEIFLLHQGESGLYLCPVCGREDFAEPPYSDEGTPSFQMCDCGFEFGFDDSPLASAEAFEGIESNWTRWRRRLIDTAVRNPSELSELELRLHRIGRRLAYDLIDVPMEATGGSDAGNNRR